MIAPRKAQRVEGEVRRRHPAGRLARRQPSVCLRRAGGSEGGLPAPLPRSRCPLRDQHRRRRPALFRQASWWRTISPSTKTTCFAACSPSCRPTTRRSTASPTWCRRRTGPSAKCATWSASNRWGTAIPSGSCCRTAGPRACIRCAKIVPGTMSRQDSTTTREFQFDEPPRGLHGRAVRPVSSHARRAGPLPALCRRRDGARLRIPRLHGPSRDREARRIRARLTTTFRCWPSASAASAAACTAWPTCRRSKPPPPSGPRHAPNTSAPSCSRSSACTATCCGSGWPATSSASTRCSCRASASASRSCGSPRRSPATARPTGCASSAACAGTSLPTS